jgi:hypothetical protein
VIVASLLLPGLAQFRNTCCLAGIKATRTYGHVKNVIELQQQLLPPPQPHSGLPAIVSILTLFVQLLLRLAS